MKHLLNLVLVLVLISCGKSKEEDKGAVEVKKADKFSVLIEAVYLKDDTITLIVKKDNYWDWDNPIKQAVKGQELIQKITFDLADNVYLENLQLMLSSNKEQSFLKIDNISVFMNDNIFFDGSQNKHTGFFNANSGLKWNEEKVQLDLNFDGEFLPGLAGNEQLESKLSR
jgi:hypothetical protein